MLGDPSLVLAVPSVDVKISSINGEMLSGKDTIKALDRVELSGEIVSNNQKRSDFNGEVFVTLYEKPTVSSTRGNDGEETVFQYQERKYQLFKGLATVTNGSFKTEFVVPKDIRYSFGNAKFSLYALSENAEDANGSDRRYQIGGSSDNPVQDDIAPTAKLFLNGEEGLTNVYPDFYVQGILDDDSGINISGLGVGHDILLTLDEGDTSWVVNDYIQPLSDDGTQYSFVFPVNDLIEENIR